MSRYSEMEVDSKTLSDVDITCANLNEENRIKWVTDLAAVSRGKKESANPKKRYEALLKEAAPFKIISGYRDHGSPSRPLEFLPVVVKIDMHDDTVAFIKGESNKTYHSMLLHDFANNILRFSYMKKISDTRYRLYTNMRALINAGVPYDEIPYNSRDEISDGKFFAIRVKSPMFVWAQFKTHCMLSSESASGRIIDEEEYWVPADIFERIKEVFEKDQTIMIIDDEFICNFIEKTQKKYLEKYSNDDQEKKTIKHELCFKLKIELLRESSSFYIPSESLQSESSLIDFILNQFDHIKTEKFFKILKYPKEIYSRAMYYFKMKEYVATAWGIDPKTWEHLFIERNALPDIWKNWTQKETRQLVEEIKKQYEEMYGYY